MRHGFTLCNAINIELLLQLNYRFGRLCSPASVAALSAAVRVSCPGFLQSVQFGSPAHHTQLLIDTHTTSPTLAEHLARCLTSTTPSFAFATTPTLRGWNLGRPHVAPDNTGAANSNNMRQSFRTSASRTAQNAGCKPAVKRLTAPLPAAPHTVHSQQPCCRAVAAYAILNSAVAPLDHSPRRSQLLQPERLSQLYQPRRRSTRRSSSSTFGTQSQVGNVDIATTTSSANGSKSQQRSPEDLNDPAKVGK